MDLSKILTISGMPGLYELISQTKTGAIVESLSDHKRCPIFKSNKISALNEISIFTKDGDLALGKVLQAIYRKEDGKSLTFEIKKGDSKELYAYFAEVVPDFDRERVYASDVKKVYLWYNLLLNVGKIDLIDPETEEKTEATEEAAPANEA